MSASSSAISVSEVPVTAGERAHRPGRRQRAAWVAAMPARAALDDLLDRQVAQVIAQVLGRGEDEVAQLQDRLGARRDCAGARDPQHADRLDDPVARLGRR
jgi:hypothetical protein